jgi:hypothetical protein
LKSDREYALAKSERSFGTATELSRALAVGPWLEDRTPLKLAELIECEFGGFVQPPMFDH